MFLFQAPEAPDNKVWVGLSAASAALVFLLAAFREFPFLVVQKAED